MARPVSLDDLIAYYQKNGIPFSARIVDYHENPIDYEIFSHGFAEDGEPVVVIG